MSFGIGGACQPIRDGSGLGATGQYRPDTSFIGGALMAPSTLAVSSVEDLPPVCNVTQTADFLSCSEYTVREMIRRGDLDHVRLGRLVKIPRRAIADFLGESE